MSGHTALPLKVDGNWIRNKDDQYVGNFRPDEKDLLEYAVRACNSFPALVEALEIARREIALSVGGVDLEVLNVIDAALLLAKGDGK